MSLDQSGKIRSAEPQLRDQSQLGVFHSDPVMPLDCLDWAKKTALRVCALLISSRE